MRAITLSSVAVGVLLSAAPSSARTFVGEPMNGCGDGFCRGPSALRYKPRALNVFIGGTEKPVVRVTSIRWRRWGKATAVGVGRSRVGDPDNGYISGRTTIRLTRITAAGCSDEAGRYRAYSRLTLRAPAFNNSPIRTTTLGC